MSTTGFTLPIISIASWLSKSEDKVHERKETARAIHDACVNYGFFYLDISSYVDTRETNELLRLAREFFALPQKEKDLLALKNEDNARGKLLVRTCRYFLNNNVEAMLVFTKTLLLAKQTTTKD